MNEWGKNSDDGVVGAMGTPRVSARSRFGVAVATNANNPSRYDYGNNDNHRVVAPSPRNRNSKGGINSNSDNDFDDDDDAGGYNRGPASLVKGAYDRHGQRQPRSSQQQQQMMMMMTKGATAANASHSGMDKDRPWRTSSTSSTNSYSSSAAAPPPQDDYEDTYEFHGTKSESFSVNGGRGGVADANATATSSSSSSSSMMMMTDTNGRWAQYETDDLEEESRRATNIAVADVASRLANNATFVHATTTIAAAVIHDDVNIDGDINETRAAMEMRKTSEIMGGNVGTGYLGDDGDDDIMDDDDGVNDETSMSTTDYVKSRLSSLLSNGNGAYDTNGNNEYHRPDHDRVRNEALKMLHLADSCLQDSPNSVHKRNNTSTATGLFRTRGGGLAMREMRDEEVESIAGGGGRGGGGGITASIAGLDRFGAGSSYDRSYGIDSHDEDDAAAPSSSSARRGMGGKGRGGNVDGEIDDDPNEETPSLWSSRYSVERQLMAITGGLDSTHMLARMDMLHSSREKTKSARGMYRSSGHAMDGSHVEYGDYTKSSSSPGLGLGMGGTMTGLWTYVRGTLWSDDLELNHDGTTQSLVKREKAMQRRRRMRCGLLFLASLSIAVGVLVHRGNPKNSYGMAYGGAGDVNFYVVADEPYEFSNIGQLTRDLQAVPKNADFVVHLGNANSDDESMCQEYGFERAKAVLEQSPVPVLVIPGDKDWAACGSEESSARSLGWWKAYLGKLEDHWDHELQVEHDDAVIGNFALLYKGVLFVGISMIDGMTTPGEVTSRLERNVLWTKEKLSRYDAGGTGSVDVHGHHVGGKESPGYHAVVIFGHAPPSDVNGEYFWPMLEQFNKIGKPVLYLHANKNGSFEQYTPYDEAVNFSAVQLEKRGVEAPMKVVVRETRNKGGTDTFLFERRESSVERER